MSRSRCPFAGPFASSHPARKPRQGAVFRRVSPTTPCLAPFRSLRTSPRFAVLALCLLVPARDVFGGRLLFRGGRS
jgi:hypothetical protein